MSGKTGGVLVGNCTKPVKRLYFGVQCLSGFAVPNGVCVQDDAATGQRRRPTAADCRSYCAYTLTVRAIPKRLRPGVPLPTVLGPTLLFPRSPCSALLCAALLRRLPL